LPPIETDEDGRQYAFESSVWDLLQLKTINLTQIFRQSNQEFQQILAHMRIGKLNISDISVLIKCIDKNIVERNIIPTSLFATNNDANNWNHRELQKLDATSEYTYESKCEVVPNRAITDNDRKELFRQSMVVRKHSPSPDDLVLRMGAQVMLRCNLDQRKRLVNGSRGIVIGFNNTNNFPIVQFKNGGTRVLEPYEFKSTYRTGSIIFTQIPLLLAFAMTIHKAEGCTLDSVCVSTKQIRTNGQAYVAFSRVRTLEGLTLIDFDPRCIVTSSKVLIKYPIDPTQQSTVKQVSNCSNNEQEHKTYKTKKRKFAFTDQIPRKSQRVIDQNKIK
jgi:ATP-dependent DNA helicase PIF1